MFGFGNTFKQDIEKAQNCFLEYLKRTLGEFVDKILVNKFNSGFQKGWEEAEKDSETPQLKIFYELESGLVNKTLRQDIHESATDFGRAVGALIGSLRFGHLRPILKGEYTNKYIDSVVALHQQRPEFGILIYSIAEEMLKSAENKMSDASPQNFQNYEKFLKQIMDITK